MSTEQENVKKQEEAYSASNIQVLEGLEAVRKRRFKVVVDAVNSVGGIVMPKLLRELGCDHISPEVTPYIHGNMNL